MFNNSFHHSSTWKCHCWCYNKTFGMVALEENVEMLKKKKPSCLFRNLKFTKSVHPAHSTHVFQSACEAKAQRLQAAEHQLSFWASRRVFLKSSHTLISHFELTEISLVMLSAFCEPTEQQTFQWQQASLNNITDWCNALLIFIVHKWSNKYNYN